MKTERMVLLVTPDEKARITGNAERLGVSASEFVRQAVDQFDIEDRIAMEELAELVPQLNAMAARLEVDRVAAREREASFERELAEIRSPAYRHRLREEVARDETIDWDAVEALFGRVLPKQAAA